jgi:hypothetical protein
VRIGRSEQGSAGDLASFGRRGASLASGLTREEIGSWRDGGHGETLVGVACVCPGTPCAGIASNAFNSFNSMRL